MSVTPWPHAYRVLGVHHEASHDELLDAYLGKLTAARGDAAWHQALTAAWAVLGDPERRAAYDRGAMAARSDRELAGAVRPMAALILLWAAACAVLIALGERQPGVVVVGYYLAAIRCGWTAMARPLRWLGWEVYDWSFALQAVLAIVSGPYVAPFMVLPPIVRWLLPRRTEIARRVVSTSSAARRWLTPWRSGG